MNIIICDDEPIYLRSVEEKLMQWAKKGGHSSAVMIYSFTSTEDLLDAWSHGLQADMVFLDIQIPGEMNGLDTAKEIHARNEHVPIVLITNYAEYACEGYRVNALRYIRKPIRPEDIEECMSIVWYRWQTRQRKSIAIETPAQILHLPIDSIIYIEAAGHSFSVYTTDDVKCYKVKQTLLNMKRLLPEELFVQCHRSFIVNLMYVHRFRDGYATLASGTEIPIGRTYQRSFIDKFREYYLGGAHLK